MEVRITRAKKEDALEFYKLEAECFEMEESGEDTLYYWVPILAYQCCYKAVADDARIVGGIVSMPTFDKQWYVNSLFVHPEYRRRGIAGRLMNKVIGAAWHNEIILDVKTDRPHLLEFYGSLGFAKRYRHRNYYRDGSDRFILARRDSKA